MITGLWMALAVVGQELPTPPPMPKRAISAREGLSGYREEFEEGGQKLVLYVPPSEERQSKNVLTIHFHSATWHAIQEHVDRGLAGPMLAFYPGEGSSIYERAFADPERLGRWIRLVADKLVARGWPADTAFEAVDITSFSAGYGAVRQLVRQPKSFALLRRVVLADSLYGSLYPPPDGPGGRWVHPDHVKVWQPLAEAAVRGEKTFAITCSEVPTETYASSKEVATALVELVEGKLAPVSTDLAAAADLDFPLKSRFDRGRFHVWLYGGQDGPAHMTHARHLADIWKALDKSGAP